MTKVAGKDVCLCEARIAPAVLEGYACGNPDCWRTARAQASFAAFVENLAAKRGAALPVGADAAPAD